MNQGQRDRYVYDQAYSFLLSQNVPGVTTELLYKYLNLPASREHIESIPAVYQRLLESAQDANMKAGVIGGSIGGVEQLGKVLDGFDPALVVIEYGEDWKGLLGEHFKPCAGWIDLHHPNSRP